MNQFMAIDQWGNTHHGLKKPRRDLLQLYDRKSAQKMYIDKKDGSSVHIGYIVAKHWFQIYEVIPWEKT